MSMIPRCLTSASSWAWLSSDPDAQSFAKGMCAGCPRLAPCLDEAVRTGDMTTVRGGTAPADRFELVEPVAAVVEHVASRGCFVAGCRRAECRAANAAYIRSWRTRDHGAAVTAQGNVITEQLAFDWSVSA